MGQVEAQMMQIRDNVPLVFAHQVMELGQRAAINGWVAATGGNFSVRVNETQMTITASGVEKGQLTPDDVLLHDIEGEKHPKASAETALHQMLYGVDAAIGAVVHVHAPHGILASMLALKNVQSYYRLEGYEMQKALCGISTHNCVVDVPVYENSQNIERLAAQVQKGLEYAKQVGQYVCPAFLLGAHGLTAWGATAEEAFRHAEALEFLFTLDLERRRLAI